MLTSKKNFRIGVVGVGLISLQSHIPAALSLPGVQLTALVDPEVDRATQVLKNFGIQAEVAKSIEDLTGKLDGAIIASPNGTHGSIARLCLQRGIHVLIEKPIAASVDDARSIDEIGQQAGLVVAVGYCTRFRENVLLAKQLIDSEYLGKVESFAYQFGTPGGWPSLSGYHLKTGTSGGGVLMVSGSHFVDRMIHFFGYPQDFSYWDDSKGGPEANAGFDAMFRAAHGEVHGVARFSKTVRLSGGMVMQTTKGRLILYENDYEPLVFCPNDQPNIRQKISLRNQSDGLGELNVFQRQLKNFVDACRQNEKPLISALEGMQSLELMQALYQSKVQ